MTRQQECHQKLVDNPDLKRAVRGETRGDGYIAALAVRTPFGIVSAVFEFTTQDNIPMLIWGVLEGLERGDVKETVARFLDIPKTVTASTSETTDTLADRRIARKVDNRQNAAAHGTAALI